MDVNGGYKPINITGGAPPCTMLRSPGFGVWRRAKNPRNGYFENVKWWETINGTLEFAHVHL